MKMKFNSRLSFSLASAIAALLAGQSAHAQSWSGTTSGDWLTTTNWTGGVEAGSSTITTDTDIAVFNVATQPTVGINMGTTSGVYYLGAIDYTNNTARTINNNAASTPGILTLNGATVNSIANTILRNSNTTLLTITNGAGASTMGLALGNATNNIIQINHSGGITIASNITGTSRNLTLAANNHGSGILTLSGTNSYTGNTRINSGTVQFTSQASLYNNGTAAAWSKDNLVVSAGGAAFFTMGGAGQFTAANINTLLGLSDSASNGFRSHATIGLDTSGGSVSFANAIANPNSGSNVLNVTKLGGNTLTLEQNSTYTGRTFISAGTLQLGNGGTTGSLSASSAIRNNGTLTINRSNAVAQGTDFSSAPIIGTGALIQAGAGTTTLNAANTFTGSTTINAGILQLDNALALQNSALVTTGAGKLNLSGPTTLTLGGLSGATGDLASVIDSGFTGTVTNLTLNTVLAGPFTYGGAIANGAMSLTKTGTGTQILSGANTYTGATIVNLGTLTLNRHTGSLAATPLTFGGSATFNIDNTGASGALSQTLGALNLNAGDATVIQTRTAAQDQLLTFGSLATRAVGASANFALSSGSAGAANGFVFTSTTNVPLASGSNDAGIFFSGANYARYDAGGFLRAVTYGTDTNANSALSGPSVTTLGATTAVTDVQFTGATRATTTSGVVSGTNTNTLAVTNGSLFAVGQILTGTNIAANTYISGISGNTLTLANAGGINAIGGTAVAAGATLTPYNSVTAQATGSANTLNLSGVGASLTLASGQTLGINGILRSAGTAAASGVISGGAGIQTTTSGGEMVVRTNLSTDVLTIATPILNNGGSSLTITGAGTLLLSGANTYAGGTFLNGGTVVVSNSNAFGASSGLVTVNGTSRINATNGVNIANPITVNAGQTLTLQSPTFANNTNATATFSGVLSGSGNLFLPNSGANGAQGILAFTNTANTFTGNVVLSASSAGDEHFQFNSLGDGGNFTFAKNGNRQLITHTGSSNITFNTRQIVVADTMFGTTDRQGMDGGGSNPVNIFQNNGSGTVSFTQDMVVGNFATNYGVLYFGGTNGGNNTFSGGISDTSGSSKFAIGKFDTGKWIFSGANTFEGNVIIGGGTLSVPTIANSSTPQPLGIGTAIQLGVGGGGANGTLLYTGSTASTDKQVQIGAAAGNAPASTGAGGILNDGTGALTFTNAAFNPATTGVTGTRTLTVGGDYTGAANEIQGVIQNNAAAGVVNLVKSGAGAWKLSGTNTYTGGTAISGGTLDVANVRGLGASGTLSINAASTTRLSTDTAFGGANPVYNVQMTGPAGIGGGYASTIELSRATPGAVTGISHNFGTMLITLNGGGAATLNVTAGANAPTGGALDTIAFTSMSAGNNNTVTETLNPTGGNITIGNLTAFGNQIVTMNLSGTTAGNAITGVIGGTGNQNLVAITKTNSSTWTLSGANSYTGETNVDGGKLLINGSTSTSSAVSVNSGGTLGGNGTIGGSVTVQANGTFAPGNSIDSIASGNLSLLASSTYAQEVSKFAAPSASGDVTVVTGTLSITSLAILTLTEIGTSGAWDAGDKITLIGYSTGTWNGGLFTYLGNTLADDSTINFSGIDWTFNYDDTAAGDNYQSDMAAFTGSARYVTMTAAIPEPSSLALLGLGSLLILRRRR